ncbi:MAG: response regulator, partial [Bacteroidota bacterium]
ALDPGGTVRLRPDQDVLTFEFVGLHYAAPGANRYQYRLEGVDADWQPLSTVREARYTRVPPGTHTFRVRAASAYGVWSDEVALATVVLPPAWWASAWFRGLLLLLGVGIAVAAYRWRTADLRDRERLLEAQVAARTDALRQAQMRTELQSVELERLNRQQRRLFANVSHETRTPLTLILGPVEDALAEADLPGRLRRTLEGVRRNGRRLLHLVDQILDLARLEAGGATLSLRPIDLGDFTTTLSGVFEEYAEGRGVDLQVEIPEAPLVGRFDVSLLEHVLFNLLSNAIKFTPAGGRVTVRLGAEAAPLPEAAPLAEAEAGAPAPEAPQIAVLVVEDTRVGIPPDDVGEVFERFALAHTGQGSGTGLGLALVKEAVEQHGGTVEVESELGRGSAFAVRLPLDATTRVEGRGDSYVLSDRIPELVVAARAEDGDDAADRTTVLVADDDPGVRAYVADVLRPAYRVLEAEDGAAALDLARDALPDLVVSDVVMPALDGLGLCVALREDPALRYVPVVLLTARVDVEDRLAGLEAGADDYLAKPFDARELRARVDNLIAARRAWRTEAAPAPFRDAFPEAVSADDQLRQRIDGVVHERFAEPGFGAGDLAEAVGLSGSQLRRRMQALYGQSPSQVVRAYRLQQGAGLLARQTGTVAEVAYAVGFNSVSYFTRAFGEAYGQTPTEYAAAAAEQG